MPESINGLILCSAIQFPEAIGQQYWRHRSSNHFIADILECLTHGKKNFIRFGLKDD